MPQRISIEFVLDEEVTPYLFARRIGMTLAQHYGLRPGEKLSVEEDGNLLVFEVKESRNSIERRMAPSTNFVELI